MAGSVEERAEYKRTMIPMIVGAILLLIGIIGMEIYTLISKKFNTYFGVLSSFILLLISII